MRLLARTRCLIMLFLLLSRAAGPVSAASVCAMDGGTAGSCCCCRAGEAEVTGPVVGPVGCCHIASEGEVPGPSPALAAVDPHFPGSGTGPVLSGPVLLDGPTDLPLVPRLLGGRAHAPPAYSLFCTLLI